MKSIEAVEKMLEMRGLRKADLARRMNMDPRYVVMKLRQKDLGSSALAEMARAMDCRVMLIPNGGRVPKGSIEIE